MLTAGFDINARNANGWTAVFSAAGPSGGCPELMRFLVKHGADPSVRDRQGRTAFDVGWTEVSSAYEANELKECIRICEGRDAAPPSKDDEPRPKERQRTLKDFFGTWVVATGSDAGAKLTLSAQRIGGDLRSMWLSVDQVRLDARGCLHLDGDHAGQLVHVSVSLDDSGRARLSWNDGVTFPAELVLRR